MAFKKILLSEAKAGMELANDIYDDKGRLLIPFGTVLDKELISRMEAYDVIVIKIVEKSEIDDLFMDSVDKKETKESGYIENIKMEPKFQEFDNNFNDSVNDLKLEFNDIVVKHKEIDVEGMLKSVKQVISSNKTKYSLFDMLSCMRGYDDLTFVHCMNVSLICSVMADWLGYSEKDKDTLMAAGLLHDIGKIKIPKDIITKPGKLTEKEYKIIKLHPVYGYEILINQPIDPRIKNATLMHHERYDGGGYPRGIAGENIDEMSKIVAIADVYDAMTANRVYREGLSPFDVIDFFEQHISLFDPKILLMFLQKTAQTYVSTTVLLSNGLEGKIAMINNNAIGHPVVICGDKVVDLSRDKSLKIVKLV